MLTKHYSPQLSPDQAQDGRWSRDFLVSILKTALSVKDYQFVREVSLQWLAWYPGDLPVDLMRAEALLGEKRFQQAKQVAKKLCQRDPEYRSAQKLLRSIPQKSTPKHIDDHDGILLALDDEQRYSQTRPKSPTWSYHLREARQALKHKSYPQAEAQIQPALAAKPTSDLVALTYLRILAAQPESPRPAIQNLAQHFHERWPECVSFMLLLADALMDGGEAERGVALLHQASTYDISAQVALRLWGPAHPYRSIWPTNLHAVIERPIPAGVAAALGWNLLPQPAIKQLRKSDAKAANLPEETTANGIPSNTGNHPKTPSACPDQTQENQQTTNTNYSSETEKLRSIKSELARLGERLHGPRFAHVDRCFPTYVILTTRRGLREKYGRAGAAMLEAAMRELAETIRRRPDWGAFVFYADDPTCTSAWDVKPARAKDAWSLKLALVDLDKAMHKQGAMIGAVLIVGGPQVVPFHSLPNPTDDPDTEVPSDNPYATRDENYFVPEWPVGRLPDGHGSNPVLLLHALQASSAFHRRVQIQPKNWWQNLWYRLKAFWQTGRKTKNGGFGYSTEVWRKASQVVFRQIGGSSDLATSPPVTVETPWKSARSGNLGYFNLHGLIDTGEWYGQRDPLNGSEGPDYPVALRIEDIQNGGHAPEIVFSEACYGAHIMGKSAQDSLALKFLDSGSRAMIGSTVMSYGSISTPLNAADLLGMAFWKAIKEDQPAGEALRRAKIHLAREMHKRQGYLDGEDQKTLISFVLYGDPLAQPQGSASLLRTPKTEREIASPPIQVKTVCDRTETPGTPAPVSAAVMRHVKQVVAQYLPGMQGAQIRLSREHCDCEGHNCPTRQLGPKSRPDTQPERRVVTLSKSVPVEKKTHPVYARLTLDKDGKVVKLAVSR